MPGTFLIGVLVRLRRPEMSSSELEQSARLTEADFARIHAAGPRAVARDARGTGDRPRMPPTVKRGEHRWGEPIMTNQYVELVTSDGKIKQVVKRTGINGASAFIDWLNFTCHETTLTNLGAGMGITDFDIVSKFSEALQGVLGYGITRQCARGRNFYDRSYELGEGFGFVCHGGQRSTILVMINGSGIAAATPGWQYRLQHFLECIAVNPRLTRVDVAHDCYQGEYTVDQADADYDDGGFRLPKSPTNPECEHRGNWKRINGKGRSFYVGLRTSGKFLRVYEKGKQLGDPRSEWVRVELELKSVDRVIPFDILVNPGCYLAGAYPALNRINEEQNRIRTIREEKVCIKAQKEDWIKRVAGADLALLVDLEQGETPEVRAYNLIRRLQDETRLPKWAVIPSADLCIGFIHDAASGSGAGNVTLTDHFERVLEV